MIPVAESPTLTRA